MTESNYSFPRKKPGDRLEASHVNALSDIATAIHWSKTGPGIDGKRGPLLSTWVDPKSMNQQVVVEEEKDDGTYAVSLRYYQHCAPIGENPDTFEPGWRTNQQLPSQPTKPTAPSTGDEPPDYATNAINDTNLRSQAVLDASETGHKFVPGDKVTVYYHEQRGAYIPVSGQNAVLKIGTAVEIITAGGFGDVKLWAHNQAGALVETGVTIEDVWHDWVTGDQDIPQDAEVIIGWFPDDYAITPAGAKGVWRIIGADCPT